MTMQKRPPNWQLPDGVSRATWDYLQSSSIAKEYDRYFAESALMKLDIDVLQRYLPAISEQNPPNVCDLGCGTGRVATTLLPHGYRMLNVDLSESMLQVVAQKTADYSERSTNVCCNLVDLAAHINANSVDFAVCLFSTLGMIRRRHFRRKFLASVLSVLKPGCRFFVHVHNRYHALFDPGGPRWLLSSRFGSILNRDQEFGDRFYHYRGLPKMFLHIYSQSELLADLASAGFDRMEILPISTDGSQILEPNLLCPALRAGGFFAAATKPASFEMLCSA